MATVNDFEAEIIVYQGDLEIQRMSSNLLFFQEIFRQLLGPNSTNTHFTVTYNGKTRTIVDPTNWSNPTCCAACKDTAKKLINA